MLNRHQLVTALKTVIYGIRPDCVKIDVEGAEIRVLKGAKRLLESDAKIVCELHPYAWRDFGNSFSDLQFIAFAAGRRIRYLDQQHEITEPVKYGTVVLEKGLD